jgi:hypothetical protein
MNVFTFHFWTMQINLFRQDLKFHTVKLGTSYVYRSLRQVHLISIEVFTTIVMSKVLFYFEKRKLIFYTSVLPFLGHVMIMLLPNCEEESLSIGGRLLLGTGFFVFGTGIGAYYSISFPAVGMAVPSKIRGLSYGVLCFFQTLAMSMVPILSGIIIEEDISNEI